MTPTPKDNPTPIPDIDEAYERSRHMPSWYGYNALRELLDGKPIDELDEFDRRAAADVLDWLRDNVALKTALGYRTGFAEVILDHGDPNGDELGDKVEP